MGISIENLNGKAKFIINGPFSIEETLFFRKKAYELLEKGENNIVIDFNNCDFIDSTGLGMLVSVHKKCAEGNGKLSVFSVKDKKVLRVFQLTRLDKVFEI